MATAVVRNHTSIARARACPTAVYCTPRQTCGCAVVRRSAERLLLDKHVEEAARLLKAGIVSRARVEGQPLVGAEQEAQLLVRR